MQTSNRKGLGDPGMKSFPLEMAHPRRDIYGTGRKRAVPLRLHHLQVIADHSKGSAQDTELVALRLKVPPCLSELCGQTDRDTLSLQPLGCCGSKLGLERANLLLRLVSLSNGLVALLVAHSMF